MASNIKKLLKQEAYDCVDTAIGKLCIFSITVGNQIELHKKLGKPISDCSPEEYARALSIYICYPEEDLKEAKYKPDSPVLTLDDTNSLTLKDLEKIAEVYVENNEYLFKKLEFRKRKNDKGEIVHYGKYSDVEYPKEDSENYISYLHRLSVKEEEKRRKQMEKFFSSVSGLSNFSNRLSDNIKKTLSRGDTLRKTMERIRSIPQATIHPIEHKLPEINWSEIEQRMKEEKLKPFNQLAERLDQLIDSSAQASEFMIEANKIQTSIAGEIKASGDTTRRFSKRNIILSIVVIIISALGFVISVYSLFRDNVNRESQKSVIQHNVDAISQKLSDINTSLVNGNQSVSENIRQILVEIKESSENESEYQNSLEKQNKIIDQLRTTNNGQRERIERLEAKIRKIENASKPNK